MFLKGESERETTFKMFLSHDRNDIAGALMVPPVRVETPRVRKRPLKHDV